MPTSLFSLKFKSYLLLRHALAIILILIFLQLYSEFYLKNIKIKMLNSITKTHFQVQERRSGHVAQFNLQPNLFRDFRQHFYLGSRFQIPERSLTCQRPNNYKKYTYRLGKIA